MFKVFRLSLTAYFCLLTAFLQAIASRIPEVASSVTDVIVGYRSAKRQYSPNDQAGVDFIVDFLNGLAQGIRQHASMTAAAMEGYKATLTAYSQRQRGYR